MVPRISPVIRSFSAGLSIGKATSTRRMKLRRSIFVPTCEAR
jgi:hypothetical protein